MNSFPSKEAVERLRKRYPHKFTAVEPITKFIEIRLKMLNIKTMISSTDKGL